MWWNRHSLSVCERLGLTRVSTSTWTLCLMKLRKFRWRRRTERVLVRWQFVDFFSCWCCYWYWLWVLDSNEVVSWFAFVTLLRYKFLISIFTRGFLSGYFLFLLGRFLTTFLLFSYKVVLFSQCSYSILYCNTTVNIFKSGQIDVQRFFLISLFAQAKPTVSSC